MIVVAELVASVGSVDASVAFGSWPAVFVVVGLADVSFGLDVGIALAEAVAAVERPGVEPVVEPVGVEPAVEPVVD